MFCLMSEAVQQTCKREQRITGHAAVQYMSGAYMVLPHCRCKAAQRNDPKHDELAAITPPSREAEPRPICGTFISGAAIACFETAVGAAASVCVA